MISFSHLGKQYGRQVLFIDASFQLNPGEKVGLVGPNGAGKTTLFRLIVGEETADEGDVSVPRKLTIGYFRQDVEEMSGRSVLDEAIAGSGRVGDLHHELEGLQHAMGDPGRADGMDAILARFGEVQEEYDHLGGYALESQAREVLHGLGFDDERIDGDVGALSGGWKMRVAMARVLLGRPDVLLMDEPTNHLDIESIVWLESFLRSRTGALLMTSHDREFMNRVVTRIAEIDGGEITSYSGNYDFYERERAIREANNEAAYARQQSMLAKEQRFIDRFSAHAAKAAQVQSRIKALDKIEKIELPKKRQVVRFDFRRPPRSGDEVATLEGVTKSYGRRVVHDGLSFRIRRGERWCVMGKNGAGKTTLLRMVAGVLAPDAGTVRLGASLKLGYFAQQSTDVLDPGLTVWEQVQRDFPRESVGALRGLLGAFQFSGDDVEKKVKRTLRRGEVAAGHGADAARAAELPRPRRAHQPPRPRDQGDARRRLARLRRHDALRVPRPRLPARAGQPRARARRRDGHRPRAAPLSRLVRRVRGADRPRGSRGPRMKGIAGVLIGAVLAQVPGPEFPSQVELVTLDAVVVDGKGRPVLDLTRDEFVVKEDGVAHEIISFERLGGDDSSSAAIAPSPEAVASTGVPPRRGGAALALIVDDQGLGEREARDTRDALTRFLASALRDGDRITLASTTGSAWWTTTLPEGREDLLAIVGRLQGREADVARPFDYMSDYESFAIRDREDSTIVARVIQRWTATGACMLVQGRPDPGCPARVRATAAAVDGIRRKRTQLLLATLRRTLDAFAQRRGRKSILLYTRGFLQDSDPTAREIAAVAREANAAVYFIDARGLQAQPGMLGAADPGTPNPSDFGQNSFEAGVLESGGAQALAEETGGLSFRNTNDLGAAAARVAGESRAYYLLGFQPRPGKKAGDWRKLKVEVTREGLTVRTRKGYTLRAVAVEQGREAPAAGKASAVMTAVLDSPEAVEGIPLRARAFVFEPRPKKQTRVLIAAEFDARQLRFEGSGGGRAARLSFSVAVTHRDTGVMQESHEQVEVRVPAGEVPGWRSLAREFDLAAGVSQARVVLRDPRAGAMGAVSHRFEVASPDALRLTTPILTDLVERGKDADDKPRAAIAIDRVFRPRGLLYCEFEVLGAPADPVLRAPRVAAGVEIRAADGRVVRKSDPTPIATDLRGRLVRLIGIGMDGLSEGDYRLVLDVRDEVSGTRLERQEPFVLRSPPD